MSVPKLKRQLSTYEVVNTSSKLYKAILKICLKMPKRYTYLVLKDLIDLANKVSDYTRGAKSFVPLNTKQAQIQISYFLHAAAALDALSGKINIFLQLPDTLTYKDEDNKKTKGVSVHELQEISNYINFERIYIEQDIEKIRENFPNLIEKKILKETYYTE